MNQPKGFCECGCGERTNLVKASSAKLGIKRGKPRRFLRGHTRRRHEPVFLYEEQDRGYDTPCWVWTGGTNTQGYGIANFAGRKHLAHRVMYEREVGPIPEGLEIDHLCSVHGCVRPDHLEAVTHLVNVRRGKKTKLTKELIEAIRIDPRSSYAIAKDYGINPSHAWAIRIGKQPTSFESL